MKIRTASRITLGAIMAAVSGSLAIAFWATTIAVADTTPSGTISARQEPTLRSTGTPQYQIFDIGVVQPADEFSQGFGVSPSGIAVGRSLNNSGSEAFSWTLNGGIVGLPNLAGRNFFVSNSANDVGVIVGTAATTPLLLRMMPSMKVAIVTLAPASSAAVQKKNPSKVGDVRLIAV